MNLQLLNGELEFAGAALLGGWALDTRSPDRPIDLDIYIDGKKVSTITANRIHSSSNPQNNGSNNGFRFLIPYRFLDGSVREISVRFSGTNRDIQGSPTRSRTTRDLSEPLPADEMRHVNKFVQSSLANRNLDKAENLPLDPIRVHVVCYEDTNSWILGKIATKLCEHLGSIGMGVSLSKEPNPHADINHHIIYWGYRDQKRTPETVMVTHIDNRRELGKVRQQLVDLGVEMGVCMSLETVERLAHFGIPREQLSFVSPAHDGNITPKQLRIGITTRVYKDGCKREYLVENLAGRLSPEHFKLIIMGSGWERIVETLKASGLEVDYFSDFDYENYQKLIPSFDYFLYTGMDEGSMGFVDAIAAAVPTIATPQGFHLDIPDGITHPFREFEELIRIFEGIERERVKKAARVADWTWSQYAYRHALIWRYLLDREQGKGFSRVMLEQLQTLGISMP